MTEERKPFDSTTRSSISASSTRSSSSSSTSTTSITRTRACSEGLSDLHKIIISEAYRSNLGGSVPVAIARLMSQLYKDGMSVDVMVYAIQETSWAKNPTPFYLRAILLRYDRQGLKTLEQVIHDSEEFAARYGQNDDNLPW